MHGRLYPSFFACVLLVQALGCGSRGGYGSGGGRHDYPTPGSFGQGAAPKPKAPGVDDNGPGPDQERCEQIVKVWPDWDRPVGDHIASPRQAFASVDHRIQTPLHWSQGPALGGRLQWNVAGQETYLSADIHIDPLEEGAHPVFVQQRPKDPRTPASECPSFWELPVSMRLASGDEALAESGVLGYLWVGAGGVAHLQAQIDARSIAGKLQWIDEGPAPDLGTDSTGLSTQPWQDSQDLVSALLVDAWIGPGIFWANLQGLASQNEQRFELANGNDDDARCQDGKRLRVGIDHPLGQLSASRVIDHLLAHPSYELNWGQGPVKLTLAAVSPPSEVCIAVQTDKAPQTALDMQVRMTFLDEDNARQLIITPHIRASLALGQPSAPSIEMRYNAFSRSQEALRDFLVRHALDPAQLAIEDTGALFELSMQLHSENTGALSGPILLREYRTSSNCESGEITDDQPPGGCDAMVGNTLRAGTLRTSGPREP